MSKKELNGNNTAAVQNGSISSTDMNMQKDNIADKDFEPAPVEYKHLSAEIHGNQQEINILEIDPGSDKVQLKPILSFNSVFGFEKLSIMALKSNAYAAVNAGFFHEYGQPGGMVVVDGEIITKSTGRYPVFVLRGKKASIEEFDTRLELIKGTDRINIDDINVLGSMGKAVLYTPKFGTDNRAKMKNTSITIENGIITNAAKYDGPVCIPAEGMVLTLYDGGEADGREGIDKLYQGDSVMLNYEPALGSGAQAYECGSWLVKDGSIVIGDKDEWVGVMTNWDPRTAIGVKANGTVVLMTVDGRQSGYSTGLTGKELARFLLDYGVNNAAMLDGGASTEMLVQGQIVNRPSHKGQERPVAGAVIVKMLDN